MKIKNIIWAGLAMVLAAMPAHAENILRWSSQGDALTFDPHAQNEGPTFTHNLQVYEALVGRGADLTIEPGLAISWEALEPTLWEFQLREGVSFHNGSPFTAQDAIFSIRRAQHPASNYLQFVVDITEITAVDDFTLHIETAAAVPLLPDQLSSILIMSKAWAEEHEVTAVQDFSAGEENYAVRNTNGTGPFVLELREPDIRTVMVRNPNWWGLEAEDAHNVDRIVFTPIGNDATRVAALLSGELDLLIDPPLQDLRRIESASGLGLSEVAQIRTIFFGLNQWAPELSSSNIRGRNPFADVRVRRAIYQALQIEAIQSRIMRGRAQPAGMIIAPGINGYAAELDTRLPQDQEAALALMVEAGYGDGFSVTLDCPNNRYVNDESICQATVAMLSRIGITVNLDAQPKSLHFPKLEERETDFYLLGWTPTTIDSGDVIDYLLISEGSWNAGGYSNADLDALAPQIASELDVEERNRLIRQVWDIALEDVAYIPLHHQVLTWARRETVDIPITSNNIPQFRWAHIEE